MQAIGRTQSIIVSKGDGGNFYLNRQIHSARPRTEDRDEQQH